MKIHNNRRAVLACPECDLLHRHTPLPLGAVARCRRCPAVLYRNPSDRPMVIRPIASVIALSIVIAGLLLGCGASPWENFYTIPTDRTSIRPFNGSSTADRIVIGPITLPGLVDRLQFDTLPAIFSKLQNSAPSGVLGNGTPQEQLGQDTQGGSA